MSRFENDETHVVISVDDSKDDRYTQGWTKVSEGGKPARKTSRSKSD